MKTEGMTEDEINARHAEKMAKKKAARDRMIATKTLEKGLLIVHTGKGKGKSTAALGMVMRAIGHGFKVGIVQFVKGKWETGERVVLERFADQVTINTMGEGFTWETQSRERDIAAARAAWNQAVSLIQDPEIKMVLLDELNIVCVTITFRWKKYWPFCAISRRTSTSSSPAATPRMSCWRLLIWSRR